MARELRITQSTRSVWSGLGLAASSLVATFACSGTSESGGPGVGGDATTQLGGASSTGGSISGVTTGGSDNTGGTTFAAGGAAATGGAAIIGGFAATGGVRSTGGNNATGGNVTLGGTPSTGGVKATGGFTSVGGTTTTGGNPTGGAKSTGGASALGGTSATGGSKATGGAPTTGGAPSTGGAKATGGTIATGGTTSVGGNNTGCGAPVALNPSLLSSCTGTNPISCSLTAANGNWDVTVELGDPAAAGSSRVQAETRHNENNQTATAAGVFSSLTFTANVRAEVHDGGQSAPANILNILIDGSAPKLHGLGIRSASCAITIFVASDSTACDWVSTNTSALAPDQAGWAQELSLYMKPGVAVANYADSGETAASFYTKFFPAARTAMKAGDYLFIQFGHNDQKNTTDVANYAANLTKYVNDAKAKGAIPVIFSPVSRASGSAANPGFAGLDQVALTTAKTLNVASIDLTSLSRAYYQTVPNFSSTLFIDGTHFHEVGAIGVAGVVANAIKTSTLGISGYVR